MRKIVVGNWKQNKSLAEVDAIRELTVHGKNVQLQLECHFPLSLDEQDAVILAIQKLLSDYHVSVEIKMVILTHQCQPHVQLLSSVKNIIAIYCFVT